MDGLRLAVWLLFIIIAALSWGVTHSVAEYRHHKNPHGIAAISFAITVILLRLLYSLMNKYDLFAE